MASNPFPSPASSEGIQVISGTCSAKDMIRLVTGNHMHSVSLVSVATVGFPLSFSLTYNSQESLISPQPLGYKWRHNYMARLILGGSLVTYVSEMGRHYNFVPDGSGGWTLETDPVSYFLDATLTNPSGTVWRLTFAPDDEYLEFEEAEISGFPDSSGRLVAQVDSYGNTTTLNYSNDNGWLEFVEEPTGRRLTLSYASDRVSSVSDPKGNLHAFVFDLVNDNLTDIVGPEGCLLTFGYADPTDHLVTSRTDGLGNTYSYEFSGSVDGQLVSVTDAETSPNTLNYSYGTVNEYVGDLGSINNTMAFARTLLDDARGNTWDYRFDNYGNLRRVISPKGHVWRAYYDPQQGLLYESEGYPSVPIDAGNPTKMGPYDLTLNRFRRYQRDAFGNPLLYFDAAGRVDEWVRDENQRVVASCKGRANLAVQGNWYDEYGADGFLLCAFESDSVDLATLPTYVSAIANGDSGGNYQFSRDNRDDLANQYIDPRVPMARFGDRRSVKAGIGFWKRSASNTQFIFRVELSEAQQFNLSIYCNSADSPPYPTSSPPLWNYSEQFGRDVTLIIDDLDPYSGDPRQQSFRMANNAPGYWATFPVSGDDENPVQVTVQATGLNESSPVISALAFDSFYDMQWRYQYNEEGSLREVSGPLGVHREMSYDTDGTLQTLDEAVDLSTTRQTQFFYEDDYKNLTRVVDAESGESEMVYDLNGNVLLSRDASDYESTMLYDGKNRLTAVFDNAANPTFLSYDAAGNLIRTLDARGQATEFFYTPSNRLERTVDALGQETLFGYDGAGNLISVTDPRSNTYGYEFNEDNQLVQVTQPDSEMLRMAHDAIGRLVAITSQNGNQADPANISVTGSANWLKNPGAELVSYYNPNQAGYWSNSNNSNNRDNGHAHSGDYSLPFSLSGTTAQYWKQANLPLAPGGRFLASFWASKAADSHSVDFSMRARIRDLQSAVVDLNSSDTNLTGSSTDWQQTDPFRFDVPGDAQFTATNPTGVEFRAYAEGSATTQAWIDDLAIHALSTGYLYDNEDRLAAIQSPDGSTTRLVRDRWGRVIRRNDPLNRPVYFAYDSLDRLIQTVDGQGNVLQYQYNFVSNLTEFTDANENVTQFGYDLMDRMLSITYPDTTAEVFAYFPNGDLQSYTDNDSREREFTYNGADRLSQVDYLADSTQSTMIYDPVGNLLQRSERNGDILLFGYDPLNRVISEQRIPSSGGPAWTHARRFDEASNQTQLQTDLSVFGTALLGTAQFGTGDVFWQVPSPGYDSMNRMPAYQDANSNQVDQEFDVESRRTLVSWLGGDLQQAATYDLMGRLLQLSATYSSTPMQTLQYGYDASSQRVSLLTDGDTFDYGLDESNRLVEEAINRFVERRLRHFAAGTARQTEIDAENQQVRMVAFGDDFSGDVLNLSRWVPHRYPPENYTSMGFELRQRDGLQFSYCRGYSNFLSTDVSGHLDPYGRTQGNQVQCLENQLALTGDFDIAVDFSELQLSSSSFAGAFLICSDAPNYSRAATQNIFYLARTGSGYAKDVFINGSSSGFASTGSSNLEGGLRLKRSGGTVTFYYFSGGSWVNPSGWSNSSLGYTNTYVSVQFSVSNANLNVRFTDFRSLDSNVPDYPATASYESTVYDAGRDCDWGNISWEEDVPSGTGISFQVAVASDLEGPYNYVGPNGTSGTFFSAAAGEALPSLNGRYCRYKAYFTSTGSDTAAFGNVQISYVGDLDSQIVVTEYDGAGNITKRTTTDDNGSAEDVRAINNLNQVNTRDVGGDTWTYAYNLDGTTADWDNGIDTWTLTWDPAGLQHLERVQGPGSVDVAYTLDDQGRLLTRASGGDTTVFQWDGWDCIGETTGVSTTRWYAPQGQLLSFDRGGETYAVVSDALGSVRLVVDDTGTVICSFSYGAWGEVLPGSFDNLPGGMPYRFVGSLGVRFDSATGLHYMRARWYDPTLQRFISRDPIGLQGDVNAYRYAANQPQGLTDAFGLDWRYSVDTPNYSNGTIETRDSGAFEPSDIATYAGAIRSARSNSITSMDFSGHSSNELIGIDEDNEKAKGGLKFDDGHFNLVDMNGNILIKDFDELLADRLANGAVLRFWGCENSKLVQRLTARLRKRSKSKTRNPKTFLTMGTQRNSYTWTLDKKIPAWDDPRYKVGKPQMYENGRPIPFNPNLLPPEQRPYYPRFLDDLFPFPLWRR